METRSLGSTGLVVSSVGFGTARFAESFLNASRQSMVDLLRAAHDRGITFFDTADMYSDGRSESMLGKAFGSRAEDVVISSKVGYVVSSRSKLMASAKSVGVPLLKRLGVVGRPSEGPAPSERPAPSEEPAPSEGPAMGHVVDERPQNFSPEAIRRGLDGSLRRLKRDYLDLYLLHGLPAPAEADDAFGALDQLKTEGKIRHFGASCERLDHAGRALSTPGVEVVQLTLNLLDVEPLEFLQLARRQSIGSVARQCFAAGVLARSDWLPESSSVAEKVKRLREIAARHGRSLAELAFRYVVDSPFVDVALVGIRVPTHLEDAITFADSAPLSLEERSELTALGIP